MAPFNLGRSVSPMQGERLAKWRSPHSGFRARATPEAVWGLLLGLGGRLGASRGRLYVNEGPERAKASWFQVATTTKRQKPPKRAEFRHQQDRAGFWTLAKRSKTPLLLGQWGRLGACRNRLCPARADKRARNGRFKVKTATKCQKPLWRAELSNNQGLVGP